MFSYVGHELAVGFQNFERHLQDFVDEGPELTGKAFRDRDVGQVAEDVIEFSVFLYVLF